MMDISWLVMIDYALLLCVCTKNNNNKKRADTNTLDEAILITNKKKLIRNLCLAEKLNLKFL